MKSLHGIALVIDDIHKGSKLAFRYPAPTSSSDATDFQKIVPSLFAKVFRPKSVLCNQSFELIIDDSRFISYPMTIHNQGELGGGEMTMFNVVFVLDASSGKCPRSSTSSKNVSSNSISDKSRKCNISMIKSVASNLAYALLHEEKRCGYVSKQVRIMLHIRDELSQTELPSNSNGDSSNNNEEVLLDPQTLVDVLLERSSLANDLKDIYHGLNENGTVHSTLNNWIKLSLTLKDSSTLSKPLLRPYHTLLLLGDEEKILETLSRDCSPQLIRLIRSANPLWSFQELQLEIGIPMNQLFRLASHLVYWGVAKIIDTVTKHNIYQVSPTANIDHQSPLAMEFKRKFFPNELSAVLSSFCGPRRLGEYMKHLTPVKQLEFVHILVWLLQHSFIFQLHRYVHLMIPSFTINNQEQSSMQEHEKEKVYLDQIATNNPVYHLFKRISIYFHGKHHLEEIMWRENVTRSEIRAVLSTYNDIAVCCLHE